jgi:hypothetical protein
MLYMWSGNVKEGRMKDYQAWLKNNEDLLQKHAPRGWTYRGTYAYVLGFGRFHVAGMWECSNYGDFDAFREHDDETWIRLFQESSDFLTSEPGEAVLLREMADTRIVEPE